MAKTKTAPKKKTGRTTIITRKTTTIKRKKPQKKKTKTPAATTTPKKDPKQELYEKLVAENEERTKQILARQQQKQQTKSVPVQPTTPKLQPQSSPPSPPYTDNSGAEPVFHPRVRRLEPVKTNKVVLQKRKRLITKKFHNQHPGEYNWVKLPVDRKIVVDQLSNHSKLRIIDCNADRSTWQVLKSGDVNSTYVFRIDKQSYTPPTHDHTDIMTEEFNLTDAIGLEFHNCDKPIIVSIPATNSLSKTPSS
jgi:hypothetical protein